MPRRSEVKVTSRSRRMKVNMTGRSLHLAADEGGREVGAREAYRRAAAPHAARECARGTEHVKGLATAVQPAFRGVCNTRGNTRLVLTPHTNTHATLHHTDVIHTKVTHAHMYRYRCTFLLLAQNDSNENSY